MSIQLANLAVVRRCEHGRICTHSVDAYMQMNGCSGGFERPATVEDLEGLLLTDEMVEAAAKAITAKLKNPVPAPTFGGTAEPAMFWGVSVAEVAGIALVAGLREVVDAD